MNQAKTIEDILSRDLIIDHNVKSIESVFENKRFSKKIDYSPYYQRNYVWDKQKATYFIESILIGTEIPPLVFFKNRNTNFIEVIDGRQRFETIKKFIDTKFYLVKSGLSKLPVLNKKNFNDLHPDVQEIFRETKLRLFECYITDVNSIDPHQEDLVKKEIFRRYNSGITPLKKMDLEKAMYIEDDITVFFKKKLSNNRTLYMNLIGLFFGRDDSTQDVDMDSHLLERVMSKIRQLLVIADIPIKRLSSRGKALVEQYYEIFSNINHNNDELYKSFCESISFLEKIKHILKESDSKFVENSLVYETLYWAIEVIKKEKSFNQNIWSFHFLKKLSKKIENSNDIFSTEKSLFYKAVNRRYQYVSEIFKNEKEININWSLFIETSQDKLEDKIPSEHDQSKNYVELVQSARIHKPEPSNETIEDICKKINRKKFLIRPIYQRDEVMDKKKSSRLIESIILGIKIPPIFLFKRKDGVSEVVDGQQRLLSIIGFTGKEFMDERGHMKKSSKNLFKLSGLEVLLNLNAKNFETLPDNIQDKILDFQLSIVTIDEQVNINFEPIDLFIRLNNKPYPIRENSFEMWNSYIDKEFIERIKNNVKKHSSWFYLRNPVYDNRMENEQCYTILMYLFYRKKTAEKEEDCIKFYQKDSSLNARLKDKKEITKTLEKISSVTKIRNNVMDSVKNVETFIETIQSIISLNNLLLEEKYKDELSNLLNLKVGRRTMQAFYILWVVLNDASKPIGNIHYIKEQIKQIFISAKSINTPKSFMNEIKIFKKRAF